MKKTLIGSYIAGIKDRSQGESYGTILGYFYQEFITALILQNVLLVLIDSFFIANSSTCSAYATLGVTNILFHFITKISEGFSIGMVVMCGQYNGKAAYKETGRAVVDSFWATCVIGGFIAAFLYFSAYYIYLFFEVPSHMIALGTPYLKLRAVGVFFNFVSFALLGFLRGIKNTRIPMVLSIIGAVTFVFFDYVLIFGKLGFTACELQGSAFASVIQFGVIFFGALLFILFDSEMRKYSINLFSSVCAKNVKTLVMLSWPVMLDKGAFALCQLWLAKMMGIIANATTAQTGNVLLSSFVAIKDMERVAILPAAAFAQVITFLVSNDYPLLNWTGIKNNIKKILMLSSLMVFTILTFFSLYPNIFLCCFDKKGLFSSFAAVAIPILSVLVFFDLLQLILSAALRGAANVKIVMWSRILITVFFFMPLSYGLAILPIKNPLLQFILVYGSLYIGNALMSVIYIRYFRTEKWKNYILRDNNDKNN